MIECVPNVSEGRDSDVVAQIANAVTNSGCHLLDVHSDRDHHRSVITMVGDRQQVIDGAVALAERAIALIDLRRHEGVHPRIGAVDVIPFIPLDATPMTTCVDIAKCVGMILASRFKLPVFLYGSAAQRKDRASLSSIRRGGTNALMHKLAVDGPDYGPSTLHPTAGAVVIGARPFLVAFNVVLDSPDVSNARTIAARLREANGGLPGIKALGLELGSRHLTQVSMNLTDIAATDVPTAFQAVAREAKRMGIGIVESEIVGLLPRVALAGASATDLCMREDPRSLVLETRMARSAR